MKFVKRIVIYLAGLFFVALGVAFSVNSNLGVSPVNSLPYVVSRILGKDLGTCVTVIFIGYILIQILLLRRLSALWILPRSSAPLPLDISLT